MARANGESDSPAPGAEAAAAQAAAEAEAAPVIAEQPVPAAGINAEGRAVNDPRVDPRPVGEVAITTAQISLFPEHAAPAVQPSGRVAPRAVNDPRGPLTADSAEAAQS